MNKNFSPFQPPYKFELIGLFAPPCYRIILSLTLPIMLSSAHFLFPAGSEMPSCKMPFQKLLPDVFTVNAEKTRAVKFF